MLFRSVLAIVAYRKGEFARSNELYKEVFLSAQRRSGIESESWGLTGRLWSLLPLGLIDETVTLLEALPTETLSQADRMCVYAALAQAYLLRQDTARVREFAERASQLAMQSPPTVQYSFPGYSGLTGIYLALWEAAGNQPLAERQALRKLSSQACRNVERFGRVFPAGKPYALLWRGLYDWLDGKPSRARRAWQKCVSLAEELATPYEQALAYYEIGRHATIDDPLREQYLMHADEILTRLGAKRASI